MQLISRGVQQIIEDKLSKMPAVALLGPRQCGKTTLAKILGAKYFDLELETSRTRLDIEWDALMNAEGVVVFDEAQLYPVVFSRLRSAIDQDRGRNGRFLILGSVSPALMTQVSESLAGRLGIVELTPLLLPEVESDWLDRLWLNGGFPGGGVMGGNMFPDWQLDYLRLLAERDLPEWGLKAAPRMTTRLMKMSAAVNAQPLNLSQLGQSLGISHPTVRSYLDFLEGAYLLRFLQPYYVNLKKRLVKAPRMYWRDSGLLHALLGVKTYEQLLEHPSVGWSWEGFVVEQLVSTIRLLGIPADFFYFRTSDGYEVDLIVEMGVEKWGIEIKCTTSPSPEDLRKLAKSAALCGCTKYFLVSRTPESVVGKESGSVNLEGLLALARQLSGR
jgi:predicted AAA+ superfamily ATPase